MRYDEFMNAVAERTGTSFERAEVLTQATLQTLAERISGGEARDMAAQLPRGLQETVSDTPEQAERFGLGEFVRRVSMRAGTDTGQALLAVRATFATLQEALTDSEFEDVMSQLPKEFEDVIPSIFVYAWAARV